MKALFTLPLLILLTFIAMAGCAGVANTTTEQATTEDAAFKARRQLTIEQQRDFDKIYLEAICQKLKGNNDAAYELLNAALEINPSAAEVLYELGMAHLSNVSSGGPPLSALSTTEDSLWVEKGDEMLRRAVELEPSNPYFRETLAERYINTGMYEEAIPLYEKMAADKPNQQNLTLLSRLYSVNDDLDNAIKTLERLEQIEGYSEQMAVEKYHMYRSGGKLKESVKCIERLAAENPQEPRFKVMLSDVYLHDGLYDEALAALNEVLAEYPNNVMAKMSLLQYYQMRNENDKVEEMMTGIMLDESMDNEGKFNILQNQASRLLSANSIVRKENSAGDETASLFKHFCEALSLPQADENIGELFLLFCNETHQSPENYKAACNAILQVQPDNAHARLLLLQTLVREHNTEAMIALCHEGTEQNPGQLAFYYYEALGLLQTARLDEAISVFEKATLVINEDSDVEVAAEIYSSLGDLYHEAGKIEVAYEAYENSLKYVPNNTGCLNNYAYFLALEGRDLDKALAMSKQTVEAEPNNPTFLDTYAWILYCKEQYTQARIYIDQTIKNLPEEELEASSSASLYDHAGDIYYYAGERESALDFWQHAQRLSDDSELTKKLNTKIKNKKP